MAEQENVHKGHRQKVRAAYLETGLRGMADHNVLELLLFYGIPQRDTNEIAHALIAKFGSFAGVLRANVNELKSVKGMTENAAVLLNMLLPVYQRYSKNLEQKKPVLSTAKEIEDFIRPYFVDAVNERVFLLCFDDNRRLLCVRLLGEGSIGNVMFDLRQLAATVLESQGKSFVLVHNHPNGIALPSKEDMEATRQAAELLQMLQVQLLNHIIIAEHGCCSMAERAACVHLFYGTDPIL